MFEMKFLPPGRGLWAMGTGIVHKKNNATALNNCAFVSTADLDKEPMKPFAFLMDASMLGVGVGFDTKGAGKINIIGPNDETETFVVPDTREGWVDATVAVLQSYFGKDGQQVPSVNVDYSKIRKKGEPLKTFGGVSSGPQPLIDLHAVLRKILGQAVGNKITTRIIVDIMNLIGKCVVSGNIRRTAEIAFGEAEDAEFLDLKNYEKNPERMEYGWTSNNSIFAKLGMDYSKICDRIAMNGEPGLAWLDNMRKYGRMADAPNNKDHRVCGGNPCLEQSLESFEMCCLVETFPFRHDALEDYLDTLKCAYLYAKTVTLGKTHWVETNRVLLRNRRIGCSMSGVAQFLAHRGIDTFKTWLNSGYEKIQQLDEQLSDFFCIPRSIKTTSIKPSGTVSLLAGATPGMHFPESRQYIRRIRLSTDSDLIEPLKEAGYRIEKCISHEDNTVVLEVPVSLGDKVRTVGEVTMFEQFELAAFMQRYWADNQVSCTVTFDPKTESSQIKHALDFYQYKLKGISLLPRLDYGAFPQMPYEEIDMKTYEEMAAPIRPINWHSEEETFGIDQEYTPSKPGAVDEEADAEVSKKLFSEEPESDTVVTEAMPNGVMFCDGDHCIMQR
eukprot:TRINITY_DN781804_c0_g1_i1.p1 TRINITY_DN781804_c0_g1~~TRINITY_DN781804_c0_g1_i1.p1  ORF type:complete len:720 (-),score=269.70 TRINITY_DN781804_c0_g1_i1:299-2137(-)